jgi:hypothetical protein
MPIATYFGAFVGVGVTCFKNSLQYLPVYRKPWEHVIAGCAGAYFCNWIIAQEESMVKQIEDYYAEQKQQ